MVSAHIALARVPGLGTIAHTFMSNKHRNRSGLRGHYGRLAGALAVAVLVVTALPGPVSGQAPTAPTVSDASVEGDTVTLTFSAALDTASVPDAEDFSFTWTDPSTLQYDASATEVSVSGSSVLIVLETAVYRNDVLTVSYTPGSNPVRTTAGVEAASFSGQSLRNDTPALDVSLTDVSFDHVTVHDGRQTTWTIPGGIPEDWGFDPDTAEYDLSVPYSITHVRITATAAPPLSTVTITPDDSLSGGRHEVSLTAGATTDIVVTARAPDSTMGDPNTAVYTFRVTRAAAGGL